jgi:hypothetical protein
MPFIPASQDTLNFAYTYTFGLQDLPTLALKNASTIYVADAFVANVLRLKRMMLAPAFIGDIANRIQRYTDIAEFEVTGTLTKGRFAPDEHGDKIWSRMLELLRGDTSGVTSNIGDPEALKKIVHDNVQTGGAPSVIRHLNKVDLMRFCFLTLLICGLPSKP